MSLTHLSLFSGIGGLDLAAEWAGFRTVGQCEFADYPTKVLEKHWPDVPRWRDIRTLTGDDFYAQTGLRTVDVISGGFPCQPFSTAGKRKAENDDRFLWPEMLRVISQIKPSWVVGENVAGLSNLALDYILSSLESEDYSARAFMVPAAGVGAAHKRDRFAILAHSNSCGVQHSVQEENRTFAKWEMLIQKFERQKGWNIESKGLRFSTREWMFNGEDQSGICRISNGVPYQMDRLKCLGNAVVPAQFYPIFMAISYIESFKD